ncbi:hypothetical protein REH65_14865 [Saccharopolyspora sp. ID03-671]|uniref:hypothetical protein n=1 Tax=Saccharopolyspora sp. ID03-671 TaxID=3073066 RepID=UPI003243EB97
MAIRHIVIAPSWPDRQVGRTTPPSATGVVSSPRSFLFDAYESRLTWESKLNWINAATVQLLRYLCNNLQQVLSLQR